MEHLLQGLLVGEVERELQLHVREAEEGDSAHRSEVGCGSHVHFDRYRDVALDLFGRQARTLRDHIHHRRRGIRIGLDVELAERDDPAEEDHHEQQHHRDALLERKGDDPVHDVAFNPRATIYVPDATRSMKRLPLVTTRSPGARPLSTSTMLPLVSPTLIRRSSIAFSLSLSRTTQTRAASPS